MKPVAALLLVGVLTSSLTAAADGDAPDFERDIAPLLATHCLECHQASKRSGELNLATRAELLKGGDSGAALVPGKPGDSLLLQRVLDREMPPPEAKEVRPLSPAQIETLRAWIAAGAAWPDRRELGVHEKIVDLAAAREFWSFRPIERPALPPATEALEAANPIDAFIAARLSRQNLSRRPRAEKAALLRRISLDVLGLPPPLAEQEQFLADQSPDAYERLVDRLLADPAYGERWARHWLDLVRYADSNGYERDAPKPSVWLYRDYVIAALNRDKPYDRFVQEQIAGDELPDASDETLIASGFHALGTWQDEVDPLEAAQYRADELDDMIRTTAQTFLGLTIGCARCHNHKFDPLTMVDYYSLSAILSPLKRPNFSRFDRDLPLGTPEQIAALEARDTAILELAWQVDEVHKAFSNQKPLPAEAQRQIADLRQQQVRLRTKTADLPRAYRSYEDSSHAEPVHLLLSGRASNPGPVMQPRVPAVLAASQPIFPASGERSTLRRLTLARWLTSRENPLTARVIVNRVWQHHFGEGLVATPSDFGEKGARPTHPDLLEHLAHWFMHDADWSLKKLHRLILTSETYRQSSAYDTHAAAADPENKLLWRFPYRRVDAETIRDSMLAAAGNLNRQMYGPAVNFPIPAAAIEAHTDKQAAWKASAEPAINRRTVYGFVKRTLLVPLLETLDFCDTTNSTDRRAITHVAPQALTLYNGDFAARQAEQFAQRLEREAGPDLDAQLSLAFRVALARPPSEQEAAVLSNFVECEERELLLAEPAGHAEPPTAAQARHRALVQACRAILNLNEFAYPN